MNLKDIPDSFGDIMSHRETCVELPKDFLPLERILLTANGNVQRILSAYFNTKVSVEIISNIQILSTKKEQVFDRKVELRIYDQSTIVCEAFSQITITDPHILDLILNQGIAIGQLFRYLNILPQFKLLQVGRSNESFWRNYTLSASGIHCEIKEIFIRSCFNQALL